MKTKSILLLNPVHNYIGCMFCTVFAQTEQQKLTATILHLDSAFWNAYNNCDTAHFKDFVTDDVEFYHDKGGITSGATALIESLNKNICGNVDSPVKKRSRCRHCKSISYAEW